MRTINIIITDTDGVILDTAEIQVNDGDNEVTVLVHDSTVTPNTSRHWAADLNIGKGKDG